MSTNDTATGPAVEQLSFGNFESLKIEQAMLNLSGNVDLGRLDQELVKAARLGTAAEIRITIGEQAIIVDAEVVKSTHRRARKSRGAVKIIGVHVSGGPEEEE